MPAGPEWNATYLECVLTYFWLIWREF